MVKKETQMMLETSQVKPQKVEWIDDDYGLRWLSDDTAVCSGLAVTTELCVIFRPLSCVSKHYEYCRYVRAQEAGMMHALNHSNLVNI